MSKFIGRKKELAELARFLRKQSATLLVVKGRRRIGKSRLIMEFAKKHQLESMIFSGLPPNEGITAQEQRDTFAKQLGLAYTKIDDWTDLFNLLAERIKKGRKLVLLDEISWMAHDDPTFLGKLKIAWDLHFKNNPKLILILCGSVSSWIDKNLLASTGFVGRVSFTLTLGELPLSDCNKFWDKVGGIISAYEKFKILSITGGVPRYLEEIDPTLSAEDNIKNLCFKKGSLLFAEFDQIFSDLFDKRSNIYRRLLEKILNGKFEYEAIYELLSTEKSGLISEYLNDLEKAGFVRRDYTWDIDTGCRSKLSKYRISDNYIRFYLKYIAPNKDRIENNAFLDRTLTSLPAWESIMGLQFENLVLSNRHTIQNILEIRAEDIIYDNPFFQTKTQRRPGCQIDYLIQTRFNTLYVCEIKFSKHSMGLSIIKEIQQKIEKLKIPKYISCRPVLIHVNGVKDDVIDSRYFADIINFGDLFAEINF